MNVISWKIIYDGGEQTHIENIFRGLYETKDWKELHTALWVWLSLDGKREKYEWFQKFGVPRVSNDCFACEQAKDHLICKQSGDYCDHCPLTRKTAFGCLDGDYDQWWSADFETRECVAEKIANAEWDIRK